MPATLLGLFAATALLLAALLYEISPVDPATFVVAAAALAGTAAIACWAPAHRSARVDPVRALRVE